MHIHLYFIALKSKFKILNFDFTTEKYFT